MFSSAHVGMVLSVIEAIRGPISSPRVDSKGPDLGALWQVEEIYARSAIPGCLSSVTNVLLFSAGI